MQRSNPTPPPRATLTVVPSFTPRRGARKGIFFLIVAFGVFPAGILLDRFFLRPSAAHWILPLACFAAYLFFARKAVLAWRPDADRLWKKRERNLK
jgi:hypothetical protein